MFQMLNMHLPILTVRLPDIFFLALRIKKFHIRLDIISLADNAVVNADACLSSDYLGRQTDFKMSNLVIL